MRTIEDDMYDQAFNEGVEFAQQWISISDKLPDTNEFYESEACIVKNKFRIGIARYYSNNKTWFPSPFKITHWRMIEVEPLHNVIK